MNDKEIVIALQKCNNGKGHRCSECPALGKYNHRICKATIDKSAANLIERLQSENARLTEQLENAEVLDKAGYRKQSDTAREFAEMLKSEMKGLTTVIKEIDKIAAEFGKED